MLALSVRSPRKIAPPDFRYRFTTLSKWCSNFSSYPSRSPKTEAGQHPKSPRIDSKRLGQHHQTFLHLVLLASYFLMLQGKEVAGSIKQWDRFTSAEFPRRVLYLRRNIQSQLGRTKDSLRHPICVCWGRLHWLSSKGYHFRFPFTKIMLDQSKVNMLRNKAPQLFKSFYMELMNTSSEHSQLLLQQHSLWKWTSTCFPAMEFCTSNRVDNLCARLRLSRQNME